MDHTVISTAVEDLLRALHSIDSHVISLSLDTLYTKYSQSNYSASELEVPTIREIIAQREQQLYNIDSIIQCVERIPHQMYSILLRLWEKRERVVSSMKMHQGFVSCLRRLPIDILREIFIQCLPERDYPYLVPDAKKAPLLLTGICKDWRTVALDTPTLWRSLSITQIFEKPEERIELYHEHWLKNARSCPLDLAVYLDPENRSRGDGWGPVARDFSRRYTTRCTDLLVFFERFPDLCQLLEDVPILERLTIFGPMTKEENITIVQPYPQARLRTLTMSCDGVTVEALSLFNPGWTNLTHLVVYRPPATTDSDSQIFSPLLQMCPNLESLLFSPIFLYKHHDPVTLTHPKLRTLGIMELHVDFGPLQDTFIFPNLQHLHVQDLEHLWDPFDALEQVSEYAQPPSIPNEPGQRIFIMTGTIDRGVTNARAPLQVFNPAWAELTHVKFDVKDNEELVLMTLRSCPRLEAVIFSSVKVSTRCSETAFTHPNLRSLSLRIRRGAIESLLRLLTLPALHILDLIFMSNSDWPHAEFKDFVSRSRCHLETLKVTGINIPIEERDELSSLTPTLKQLELDDPDDPSDVSDVEWFSDTSDSSSDGTDFFADVS